MNGVKPPFVTTSRRVEPLITSWPHKNTRNRKVRTTLRFTIHYYYYSVLNSSTSKYYSYYYYYY